MQTTSQTEGTAFQAFLKAQSDVKWAEAAGRSQSTLNRLWRKFFQAEDRLKLAGGGWS